MIVITQRKMSITWGRIFVGLDCADVVHVLHFAKKCQWILYRSEGTKTSENHVCCPVLPRRIAQEKTILY
jgi:hypothetical protein